MGRSDISGSNTDKIKQLIADIQSGDQQALARGITMLENELPGYEELLYGLKNDGAQKLIGITGPPGAGKSTLVNGLLSYWTSLGKKVAVLAVDPSSPFHHGAVLGDRIRMNEFYTNPNVYIRSLATRGALGGLNAKILEITDLVRNAPFDYVLVETVGVGQSEVEIAGLADCTVVTMVPGAGDGIQMLKAGLMEIADIFVVNKADNEAADALYQKLRVLVHEQARDGVEVPVHKTIATEKSGILELSALIDNFLTTANSHSEHKLRLLTDKSWQLLEAIRMKGLSKSELEENLRNSVRDKSFNLYMFLQNFANRP
jgi:LAO/AO transport system kinase